MVLRVLALFVLSVGVFGCGRGEGGAEWKGRRYVVLAGEVRIDDGGDWVGAGKVVFVEPVGGAAADRRFEVSGALEDEGSVRLLGFGDRDLNGAVSVLIERSGDEARVSVGEVEAFYHCHDWTEAIRITAEVHNSESPRAHVLVSLEGAGCHLLEEMEGEEAEHEGHEHSGKEWVTAFVKNGRGGFWGVEFQRARIAKVTVGAALETHE